MSTETAEATAPAKSKSTKPKAKAPAKGKAPAAKKAKIAPKAAPAAPRAKKDGLREPQARILRALSKAKGPLTRTTINEACAAAGFATAEKFSQWMADPLGSPNPETRTSAEERSGYPSLLTLKFVAQKAVKIDERDAIVYSITDAGKKALVKYDAEQKEKAKAAK